jgi:hypothetical protein
MGSLSAKNASKKFSRLGTFKKNVLIVLNKKFHVFLPGNPQPSTVAYLNNTFGHKPTVDIVSDFGLVEIFEKVDQC